MTSLLASVCRTVLMSLADTQLERLESLLSFHGLRIMVGPPGKHYIIDFLVLPRNLTT